MWVVNTGTKDVKIKPGGSGAIYKKAEGGNTYPSSGGSMVKMKKKSSITWAYDGTAWYTVAYSGSISND